MLVWQAVAAQEIWTGASFSEAAIKSLCCEMEILLAEKYNGIRNGDKS
jgi:hypothetical protein